MNACNFTHLTGRIIKLEEKETATGKVINFALSVKRRGKNVKQKEDIFDIVAWSSTADIILKNSGVGKLITVCGENRKDSYVIEGEKRYKSYIFCEAVNIIEWNDSKKDEEIVEEQIKEVSDDELLNQALEE